MDRRPPLLSALLVLTTCVSLSDTSPTQPPPPPPPPPGPFADFTNPEAISAAVATIDGAFAAPVYGSLTTFASALSVSGGHAPVPAAPLSATCAGLRAAPVAVARAAGLVGIPDSMLGRVFSYDSATQSYQRFADSGGPAGGVRFLLPQVDTKGSPVYPLTTIGWLDAIDQSAPSGPDRIQAELVGQGITLADYVMAPAGTTTTYLERLAGVFGARGYSFTFRDSTTRLGSQVTAAAFVDDTSHDLHASLVASRTASDRYDNFYTLDFRFRYGADSLRLQGSINTYCLVPSLGLTVSIHDSTFATVTNGASPYQPDVTRADGNATTPSQRSAVLDVIRVQGELFHWLEMYSLPGSLLLGN